jgi:hypothetical protein
MAVSMIGYRRWQKNIAIELLAGRGLSEPEAMEHIRMVNQRMRVPIFASATIIAGLQSNEPILNSQQKVQQVQQSQYDSIYGVQTTQDPNAGFASQSYASQPMVRSFSQGSQEAAADALAMFAEVETEAIIETKFEPSIQPVVETKVHSGGIELPQTVKSQISIEEPKKVIDDTRKINCPECQHEFKVKVPKGVAQAVVACPSCESDFGLEFV